MVEEVKNPTLEPERKDSRMKKTHLRHQGLPDISLGSKSPKNLVNYEKNNQTEWWNRVWGGAELPTLHREVVSNKGLKAVDTRGGQLRSAIETCQLFADQFPQKRGLYLSGSWGCGKTLLAVATAHEVAANAYRSIVDWWDLPQWTPRIYCRTMSDVLHEIRFSFDRTEGWRPSTQDVIATYKYCALLILDDVGNEKITDWTKDELQHLINFRYHEKRPTIFTSNLSLDKLAEQVSTPVADRIHEMCDGAVVDIRLDSFRGRK